MILMIDNYDSFTYNLYQYLGELGAEVQVARNDAICVDAVQATPPAGLIVSPGPGTPDEAGVSLAAIEALGAMRPVLGVCLGMQGLGTAYGGRVQRVHPAHGEIAVVRHDGEGLFAGVPDAFRAVRYHSLAAVELPKVLRRTAVDEVSGVAMAVAHTDRPLLGVQFHPESVLSEHGADLVRNFLS